MRTGLYEKHAALGAKLVDFAGWEMPLQYEGIIHEHKVVREKVGIFDVSHMGRVSIEGPDAEKLLDYLSTNKIAGTKPGTATYTVWCNAAGGAIDDLLIYREAEDQFFVVFNAANREGDLKHLQEVSANYNVTIRDHFDAGIVAVQGLMATPIVSKIFPEAATLRPMRFLAASYRGGKVLVAATGYTGAGGFELYAPTPTIVTLWDDILACGAEPIGLGARDTLRLEMGFALYGHELSTTIAPTESVSRWTVKWDKGDFLGREALELLEKSPGKRSQYGVVLADRGIAREGFFVSQEGAPIGVVTSGTMSPSLNRAVAIILVDRKLAEGDNVEIEIRGKPCSAQVVKLPFYKR